MLASHTNEDNCGMNGVVRVHEGDKHELEQVNKDWSPCQERCCAEQLAEESFRQVAKREKKDIVDFLNDERVHKTRMFHVNY